MSEPYLNVDDLEAFVPWGEWEFPPLQIAAVTSVFVGLILASSLIDRGNVESYLAAAAAMAVLLPAGLLLTRYLYAPPSRGHHRWR